jgi:nickel/cobalt transporter (NiCoT) family protein
MLELPRVVPLARISLDILHNRAAAAANRCRQPALGEGKRMTSMPADWGALCALVLLLGLKHGFDADHIATIDGLTRFNAGRRQWHASWCGLLFSAGHGLVVLAFAAGVALAGARWQVPGWLGPLGAWLSIGFLTVVGVVNLRAVLGARADQVVLPVGLKGRVLGRLHGGGGPLAVAAVGGLFALSFDTVSQAALFAVAGIQWGGFGHALALAALFAAGMILTDTLGGLWIARLIARADQLAVIASRVMGLAVAGVSLLVAGLAASHSLLPALDGRLAGSELLPGVVVCALMAASYVLARRLARASAVQGNPAGS